MKVCALIQLLKMFPENMDVLVQTCQGDLMQPLSRDLMWVTEAFIDERYKNLEPSKLVITSYLSDNGDLIQRRRDYSNPHSGVLVKYNDQPSRDRDNV